MNKNYILTLLMSLCLTVASFGQELMLNGGLENWTSNTRPTDWTTYQNITQESTEKHGGSFSAKLTKDASGGFKKLNQTVTIIDTPSNRGMVNKISDMVEVLES